jgi:uncharacterized protein
MTTELRISTKLPAATVRVSASGRSIIEAYGSVYMRYSQNLGGFVEQVAPGAFDDSLSTDLRSMWNHDPSRVLGRSSAGNLTVTSDVTGMKYSVEAPDTSYTRDLVALIDSGIVKGSSFAFRTLQDSWSLTDQGFPLRTLEKVALYEVGPVTDPAYLSTEETGAAVALRSLSELTSCPLDELVAAAGRNELRSYLPGGSAPIPPVQTDEDDEARNAAVLASQRARRERTLRLLAVR